MLARGARTYVLFNCSTVVTALIACQTLTSNCSRAACSWMKHVLKPSEPMQLHAESRRRGRPPSLSNRLTRASWGVWWSCNSCCQRHRSMTIICYCFRYVCHELRNPLHAIAGLVETEDAGPGSTSKKEVLDLCAHMRTILDDMLDLGKVRNRNSAVLVNDVLVISMQWTDRAGGSCVQGRCKCHRARPTFVRLRLLRPEALQRGPVRISWSRQILTCHPRFW